MCDGDGGFIPCHVELKNIPTDISWDQLLAYCRSFGKLAALETTAGGLIRHGVATYTNELDQFLAAEGAHAFVTTSCKDEYGVFGDEEYSAPAYRKGTVAYQREQERLREEKKRAQAGNSSDNGGGGGSGAQQASGNGRQSPTAAAAAAAAAAATSAASAAGAPAASAAEASRQSWEESELQLMLKLVGAIAKQRPDNAGTALVAADWTEIAEKLGTGRPGTAVRSRHERHKRQLEEREAESKLAHDASLALSESPGNLSSANENAATSSTAAE